MSDLILYTSDDGKTRMNLRVEGKTIWLTQLEIAELFSVSVPTVNEHIKGVYDDDELKEQTTLRDFRIVQTEGDRQVQRLVKQYSLELILAVGFRVRSARGTQFRKWATTILQEYMVKGFVLDDERLKNAGRWDHFDELLARIRDIRASEKRFYQKVRELFALSSDYKAREQETHLFFAEVQNKLLFATTRHTAAEIVVMRADSTKPNMNLTSWDGQRVRKQDVIVAKNYLSADEVDTLNRLVVIFLEQAELRVKDRKDLTLAFWRENVDKMLAFNDRPVFKGPGKVSHEGMKEIVHERYGAFDAGRRAAEAIEADAEDLRQIEDLDNKLKQNKKKPEGGEK
jgi:hypothetical protein